MKQNFRKLNSLIARNVKIYFKDKLTFFVSLITPIILLFLFFAFLREVYEGVLYEDVLSSVVGKDISKSIVNAFTGGWLFSSIMATSCITVAFCSGMLVYDKINKAKFDLQVAPISPSLLHVSYVVANFITTMIVCLVLFGIGLVYFAIAGWYFTFWQIVLILLNMMLTTLFGCLLANTIWLFVSSQGALSGVCTMVSSMYGFIVGAYMPLDSMGGGIQHFASLLPGTYSTILFRKMYMNGVMKEIGKNLPTEAVLKMRKSFDCDFEFFGHSVGAGAMFGVVLVATFLMFLLFVLLSSKKIRNNKK